MAAVLGELLGRQTGLMAGKGGSMHLTYTPNNFMGSYAIVGAHLTIANGAAWSAQYRGTDQVTVVFFGDGTTNIGAFHEALNLAATWKLPVIFICENNLYMEYTPIGQVTAVPRPAADRASAYGSNRWSSTATTPSRLQDHPRGGSPGPLGAGPSLVEAVTYPHGGHSRADPGKYRPDSEVAEWLTGPNSSLSERLLGDGVEAPCSTASRQRPGVKSTRPVKRRKRPQWQIPRASSARSSLTGGRRGAAERSVLPAGSSPAGGEPAAS